MKILISGSESITVYSFMEKYLLEIISKEQYYREVPTWKLEPVSTGNPRGVDYHVLEFSRKEIKKEVSIFKADWNNLNDFPCFPKKTYYGVINSSAGYNRNTKVINSLNESDLVIAFDDDDKGIKDLVKKAKKANLKVYHIKCEDRNKVNIKIYNGEIT